MATKYPGYTRSSNGRTDNRVAPAMNGGAQVPSVTAGGFVSYRAVREIERAREAAKPLPSPAAKLPNIPKGSRRVWLPPVEGARAVAPSAGGRWGAPSIGWALPAIIVWYGADGIVQAFKNPRWRGIPNLPTPPGYYWILRHGPNEPAIYYPTYTGREAASSNAFLAHTQPTGPGTGVIAGQSIAEQGPLPGDAGAGAQLGWWVHNGTRWGQIAHFRRYNDGNPLGHPTVPDALRKWLGPNMLTLPVGDPLAPTLPDLVIEGEPALESAPAPAPAPLVGGVPVPFGVPWHLTNPDEGLIWPFGGAAPFVPSPVPTPEPGPGEPVSEPARPGPPKMPTPKFHWRRPPRKGTKEKKSKMDKGLWAGLNALGGWSEVNDAVDAAWYALPKNARSSSFYNGKPVPVGWQKKWNDIYRNWHKVDVSTFIQNLAKGHLADKYAGKLNRAIDSRMPWAKDRSLTGRFIKRNAARQFLGYPF